MQPPRAANAATSLSRRPLVLSLDICVYLVHTLDLTWQVVECGALLAYILDYVNTNTTSNRTQTWTGRELTTTSVQNPPWNWECPTANKKCSCHLMTCCSPRKLQLPADNQGHLG
ncbi:hypothetical protein F4824DRAFT_234948 [Ustulina deusta]|nr:hypothetical protein F4823DRAFT_21180 [Ustulina deusta]KAI3333841.1 hypothetical protein F4824DRAFT_234948 [Ustulina deusta]